ncbi:MAG: hypothetical protein FJX72_10695 [Armatimonadetes bacterium]|nr:hypothetical protein [Armatimonadota bacterium]
MSWQRRLRHLALSQVRAIKDRLDQLDAEDHDSLLTERNAREAALRELDDEVGLPPLRPSVPDASSARPSASAPEAATPAKPERETALGRAYRILGVPDGADLSEVEAAYHTLANRCRSVEFAEGSEERETADAIMARVDEAYNQLREALNPAAGRFDKLEL